jgi:hypothetical protein
VKDLDETIYRAYRLLRRHGSVVTAALAWSVYRRAQGPRKFVAGPNGVLRTDDKVALLAELRLIALRQFPAAFVAAKFDR